ncbi:unnamed protein product [Lota lota]
MAVSQTEVRGQRSVINAEGFGHWGQLSNTVPSRTRYSRVTVQASPGMQPFIWAHEGRVLGVAVVVGDGETRSVSVGMETDAVT